MYPRIQYHRQDDVERKARKGRKETGWISCIAGLAAFAFHRIGPFSSNTVPLVLYLHHEWILNLVAELAPDTLGLEILVHRLDAVLPADAARFVAAKRRVE